MRPIKTYLILPTLLLMALSCAKSVAPEQAIVEQKALLVGNAQPVDGCDAHFVINYTTSTATDGTPVLPSEATRPLFDKVIKAEEAKQANGFWMGQKEVTIRYRAISGTTGNLPCGRVQKSDPIPLIELIAIQ